MRRKNTTKLKRSLNSYFRKPSIIGFLLVVFFGAKYYIENNTERTEFSNSEIRVIDGDSLAFGALRIRLQGIDAPELKQECRDIKSNQLYRCGQVSRDYLISLIAKHPVKCSNEGLDRYKRQLAYCYVGDINLNREMIRSGNAVAYLQYDKSFGNDEKEARSSKVGLWMSEFIRPEEYRKANIKLK